MLVFDAVTGAPVAFLLDGGLLTDLRTGAAGGVAARWLAPDRVDVVAVIGTGIQARRQVEALRCVRPALGEVRVWGRDMDRAMRAAHDIGAMVVGLGAGGRDRRERGDHLHGAREPLVEAAWMRPGTHITAVGSDGVGQAGARSGAAATRRHPRGRFGRAVPATGELQHATEQADRAVALGRICGGEEPGRTSAAQLTICDLTGVGVQDVAAANAVLANAPVDAGERIEL